MKNKKRLKLADKAQRRIQTNGHRNLLIKKGQEIEKELKSLDKKKNNKSNQMDTNMQHTLY